MLNRVLNNAEYLTIQIFSPYCEPFPTIPTVPKVETKLPDRLVCVKTNKRNNPVLALIIPKVQQRRACGVRMLLIEGWSTV